MKSDSMTRKEFVTLTFTLIGVGAVGSCSSTTSNADATGAAGTATDATGASGNGGGGASGTTGGSGAGGASGASGTSGATCMDPLPEVQDPDANGHVHMVTVPASTLNSTTAQTFTTTMAGTPAHTHMITLTPANLTTLKGGATVDVMSTTTLAHFHSYTVGCTSA
jgi:hypothetical protein